MNGNWFRFYRKMYDGDLPKHHGPFLLWIYLLAHVVFKEHDIIIGGTKVNLKPGQFLTNFRHLAKETGLSLSAIRNGLRYLVVSEQLTHETTRVGAHAATLVTIINLDVYQPSEHEEQHKEQHGEEHSNKKVKNEKKKKSDAAASTPHFAYESDEFALADGMLTIIRESNPTFKQPDLQSWANEFHKILTIDKRPLNVVDEMLEWALEHRYWSSHVLSPSAFRKKYDQIYAQWSKAQRPQSNYGGHS